MSSLTPDDVLLGILAAADCHGYQLLEHFRQPSELGLVWNLSTSQLYAVLKRIEKNNFIVGREVESPDAPPRTEYHLTNTGKNQLEHWLFASNPSPSVRRVRVEFLSRLYVARLLNIPTLEIVQNQKHTCQKRYQELLDQRSTTEPGIGFLAVELNIAQLSAILQWITRCELKPLEEYDEN